MIAAILALAGVFLLAPGGAFIFDGLPINGPFEFISAAGLVVLAVSSSARAGLATRSAAVRRLLLVLVAAGLLGKAAVIIHGRYEGFLGCYQAVVTSVQSCTQSYDNPFRLQHVTRIDPRIDFDQSSWRLGLLNNRDYDFARDNSAMVMHKSREELAADLRPKTPHFVPMVPFAAVWQSTMTVSAPAAIIVRHVGEGAVEIDGSTIALDAHLTQPPAATQIPISEGTHQLVVRYHWAPSVDLEASAPKTARLSIDAPATVRFGTSTALDLMLRKSVDVLGALAFVLLFAAALQWRAVPSILIPAAIGLIIAVLPVPPWWRDKLLELTMIAVCLQWISRRMVILPFILLLAAMAIVRVGWASGPAPGVVHERAWGDDGLTYDSFAREILEKGTLRAGEDSFRGQPLFRYVRFVERVLMGEDEWLIVVYALVLFCVAYSWLARRALDQAPEHLVLILATTVLLLWITGGAIAFVDSGMTEYPTWILAPVITGLLLLGRSTREHFVAAVLIGLGVLFRFNHLPAYAVLLAIVAMRPADFHASRTMALATIGVAVMVVSVPMLAHNLYYGHQWQVIPASAQVNYDLPVDAWSVSTLLGRLGYLVHIGTDAATWFLPLHALQLIIAAVAAAVLAGRWRIGRWYAGLLLAPAAALSVHLVLAVNVYYPRHILFAYLLAGAIVLVLAAEDGVACDSVIPGHTQQRV